MIKLGGRNFIKNTEKFIETSLNPVKNPIRTDCYTPKIIFNKHHNTLWLTMQHYHAHATGNNGKNETHKYIRGESIEQENTCVGE